MTRPLPDLHHPEFAEHWAGLAEGRVRIRQCQSCGQHAWPPRPACRVCVGLDHKWVDVAPQGFLYSWTVVGHATLPGFEPPYAVVLGELEVPAGVRLLGSYKGDLTHLRVGLPLVARPMQVTEEVYLLNWTLAGTNDTDDVVATEQHDKEVGEHQ
ncbi:Zn-ribbon domain-containing OB-fold protein [Ornithinimicrobium faecis]|uniref:Zn-ribbon domain-containing OB-fold protein n=1 Tax=Ornithinimicrobium faecis TaxID=2934158 RepID=UPI003CE45880